MTSPGAIESVCVYCSSSNAVAPHYFEVAAEAGRILAGRGLRLVYGGGAVGLMGELARSVHRHGGSVLGVIPEALREIEGVAYDAADEMIITRTMQERKAIMYTRADAFLVLPGGFGTLEEFMEVLTLKQLRYHHKPIALVSTRGFFDPLIGVFEHFFRQGFANPRYRSLYYLADEPADAVDYLIQAEP